jgi:hypothetical protein
MNGPGGTGASGRLPNFFLAGAPKTGSTSLHHYLRQHPQIFMSPVKEPHYFADEVRIENFGPEYRRRALPLRQVLREFLAGPMITGCSAGPVTTWPDYLRLFQRASAEIAVGESSVCYLWSHSAARNIAARIPNARILIVLRNPIERAFSQYLHMLSFAESHVPFREHVLASVRSTTTCFSPQYPFLEFGRYGEQLQRLFTVFPRDRVRILFYEDYCRDAAAFLEEIFRFLGVDEEFTPELGERYMEANVPRSYTARRWLQRTGVWNAARGVMPQVVRRQLRGLAFQRRKGFVLRTADRALLADYYREDVAALSRLLDLDLTGWLATP